MFTRCVGNIFDTFTYIKLDLYCIYFCNFVEYCELRVSFSYISYNTMIYLNTIQEYLYIV